MATREEMHSTRGRARLLFEMLEGNPLIGGWKDDHVREALDLCLACKACKTECPVNVDMAAYKAEFLSHYYEHRLRPRSAYTMGWIHRWARAASHWPKLVNWASRAAPFETIAKMLAGISPKRTLPRFASRTFTSVRRNLRQERPGDVILWPDTFNNHFHPQVLHAAFDSLRRLGYEVRIPKASLCCGRPLYDFGFLATAKNLLIEIMKSLREHIRSGRPIIVLEPSCASVFKDELVNFFPSDPDAIRLSRQTVLLSEFLAKHLHHEALPQLRRKVLVHGHCHQKSLFGMDDEERVLQRLGLDYEILDSGCCGMAGAFGFEKNHYDVSILAGDRVLLPRVRQAPPDTLIVTNGFSCREQILQCTGRRTVHLAEVLDEAFKSSVGTRHRRAA
jgi:Fe-S oxidoreductase